jgi:HD superfamily phosphodiesterase
MPVRILMTDLGSQSASRLDLPDSDIACAARQFAFDISPVFVANHSVRSYLFARELAAAKGLQRDVDYDDELVFLSCMLHDLGLTDHANGYQRFEVDGADAAARFLCDHGVEEARVTTVWQAIALHTSVALAHRFGAVQAVAQMGISADIVGADREMLPTGFADRVHASLPRHDLGYALAELIARQVEDNPEKGNPMTYPGHLHQLIYRTSPVTWFDVVRAAGWNDQPSADRSAETSPPGVAPKA